MIPLACRLLAMAVVAIVDAHVAEVDRAVAAECGTLAHVGMAVVVVESQGRPWARNGQHLGMMQVAADNLFVARAAVAPVAGPWDVWGVRGGAAAGCRALRYWHERDSVRYLRAYRTGCTGLGGDKPCRGKDRDKKVATGQAYERKVRAVVSLRNRRVAGR